MPQNQLIDVWPNLYIRLKGARNALDLIPMRQLPNRWVATAEKPGSSGLASYVRKSSAKSSRKPMSDGFSLESPRGSMSPCGSLRSFVEGRNASSNFIEWQTFSTKDGKLEG